MRQFVRRSFNIGLLAVSYCCVWGTIAKAQITPDNTVNTTVNQNGNVSEITGGQTAGNNLFHSFQDFSVPTGNEASFNNADTIENIFSRVTGGNVSNIDGLISANGSASLFLINPAGIIFGENATLNIGGSFIGSSADSILFPDDIAFSASDTQAEPILTVNAPIGLGFRDNPGDIVNRSVANNFTGLTVPGNETIALVGGDINFEGGLISTPGGRIEIGSVAGNNIISINEVEKGWDISYEDVTNFRDINLAFAAFIVSTGENTGDVQIQGRNISLEEGSQVGISSNVGEAGNISVIASESLKIDGNGLQVGFDNFPSSIFNNVFDRASGANSQIIVESSELSLSNTGEIIARNIDSISQGVDISIRASEIFLDGAIDFESSIPVTSGLFTQTFEAAQGKGGSIDIDAANLIVNNGAQINTETFGVGDAGDLIINVAEFIELTGTNSYERVSSLFANTRPVQANAVVTGNGGDIFVNTSKLIVQDGAQIASATESQGSGGNITVNAVESILLSGTATTTQFNIGRTGITAGTRNFSDESNATGNAGNINVATENLFVEQGAAIATNTFSLGNGGSAIVEVDKLTVSDGGQIRASSLLLENAVDNELGEGGNLNVTANDSVLITGTGDINGQPVVSGISTVAEGTGGAGSLTLTTEDLSINNEGEINASATGSGSAGNLKIETETANLERGDIRATTFAGNGGNIELNADNLTLRDESQISAAASRDANGGNINIDADFVVAFPSQPEGSDITARAEQGTGGNIDIMAESLLGIEPGEAIPENKNNDIDASSEFGLDGSVTINILDLKPTQELTEIPENVTDSIQTAMQACQDDLSGESNTLVVRGKGQILQQLTEPLNSEAILVGQDANRHSQQSKVTHIESFQTSKGQIVPARGVKVTEEGQITLTPHLTENLARKSFSQNCS